MKLSEMTTRRAAECLCDIAAPVGRLLDSPALKTWYEQNKGESVSIHGFIPLVPVLLRDHYDDTAAIVAALTGKTREQIDNQPIMQTVHDVQESMDEELISFFRRAPVTEPET